MSEHIVTEKAMRPAAPGVRRCYYCNAAVGRKHGPECVCVVRKFTVTAKITYDILAPSHWLADDVEFHRNEGSWCTNNMLDELAKIGNQHPEGGVCLCGTTKFQVLALHDETFLREGGDYE